MLLSSIRRESDTLGLLQAIFDRLIDRTATQFDLGNRTAIDVASNRINGNGFSLNHRLQCLGRSSTATGSLFRSIHISKADSFYSWSESGSPKG